MFRRVYLDNSATTAVDPQVVAEMLPFFSESFGNASSIHFFGQEAKMAVDRARHQAAQLINCRANEIVFTSGGTESNNLAVRGILEANEDHGRHFITSTIEHSSIRALADDLEQRGWEVTRLSVGENGVVDAADVEAAIRPDTVLISIMTANNEIGTLQPVAEIGRMVKRLRETGRKIWFHTDAVQAAGKAAVDVEESGCDLLSISGHKCYAPKGVGLLYVRRGVRLHAQNIGGRQERGRRGGTESVPHIVALGKACELAAARLADESDRLGHLRDDLESSVAELIPNTRFNGDRVRRLPNIANISFPGVEGEALLINLDMQGVAVSTGSACSSGSLEPSPVIRALGHGDDLARTAIRFSFGSNNTPEDVDRVLEVLPRAVETLRKLSPAAKGRPDAASK